MDYGPQLPQSAIRRSSLLTLGQIHEYQVSLRCYLLRIRILSPQTLYPIVNLGNKMVLSPALLFIYIIILSSLNSHVLLGEISITG